MNNNGVIIDVPVDLDSASFKYKQKIADEKGNNGNAINWLWN